MIDAIIGRPAQLVEKNMQLRMMRQGLLASNIANAETPNYRAIDIDFRRTMDNLVARMDLQAAAPLELRRTDARHFSSSVLRGRQAHPGGIVFAAADAPTIGAESNSTSLEVQLGRLQSNAILFSAMRSILGGRLSAIKGLLEASARV